ncbi:MAG: 4Fe-4S binding protein [Planctomycetota bacterium]
MATQSTERNRAGSPSPASSGDGAGGAPGAAASRNPLASLPRLDRHKPKGDVKPSGSSRWRAIVLILVHVAIGLHIWHWLATGESITPVEPSEAMQTVELGRINAGFLLFLSLIATTLLFGRWFCGWACHVVALQDLSAWLLGKVGFRPKPVRSRLLVFTPWVVGGYMFLWPMAKAWLWRTYEWPERAELPGVAEWRWELTTQELWQTFPGPIMAVGTFVVVGFLVVWWLGAKGFCTYGCPYGAFFATADRLSPMRIKVDKDLCEACGHCTSVCTSNVRVHEEVAKYGKVVDPGCMKCMDCVSSCPTEALSFGLAAPKPFAISQQRIRARADFAWWEELLLAGVAVWATQWAFRGAWFAESVPLLMAVGLGVITAVFALLAVRLMSRRDVTFQSTVLRQGGSFRGVGLAALVLSVLWVGFAAHTSIGKQKRDAAVAAGRAPVQARMYGRDTFVLSEAQSALALADEAKSWALVPDPQLLEVRGMLLGVTGRDADAATQLEQLYEQREDLFFVESKLMLARYWALRGDNLESAKLLVEQVLAVDGNNRGAAMLLHRIQQRLGG